MTLEELTAKAMAKWAAHARGCSPCRMTMNDTAGDGKGFPPTLAAFSLNECGAELAGDVLRLVWLAGAATIDGERAKRSPAPTVLARGRRRRRGVR